MYIRTNDGSIETPDGRVIYFSLDRFISEIAKGSACFICGGTSAKKSFNNEHVLPDWVLKRCELHSRRVTLPNSEGFMYGRYVIPCCTECNALMSELFEVPISAAFEEGYRGLVEFMKSEGGPRLFVWLAMLFLKTHLKDRDFRWDLDARRGNEKIADIYDWTELHHIHCLVRSFYSGASLSPRVFGSVALLRATKSDEQFDYGDLLPGKAVLLRLGDVAVLAILNDSGAVIRSLKEVFDALTGPLTSGDT